MIWTHHGYMEFLPPLLIPCKNSDTKTHKVNLLETFNCCSRMETWSSGLRQTFDLDTRTKKFHSSCFIFCSKMILFIKVSSPKIKILEQRHYLSSTESEQLQKISTTNRWNFQSNNRLWDCCFQTTKASNLLMPSNICHLTHKNLQSNETACVIRG